MLDSKQRSSRSVLWVVGAVLLVLVFGCMLLSVGGFLFYQVSAPVAVETSRRAQPAQDAQRVAPAAIQEAPARVVITPPEEGVDYETAVLMNVYQEVNASVVNVTVLGRPGQMGRTSPPLPEPEPDGFLPFGSGSGFIWDSAGHIVTNNHVVEGADEVQITFSDGTAAIAQIVGTDVDSDLAVLLINPNGYVLRPVARGNLEEVQVGMRVAAIGNPFGLEGTLTSGIVSAIGRSIPARQGFQIPDSIQTDAPINPGNSGGPLLNERGEVIGVNAQIRSEVRANSGIGFAIPITVVERVVPALIEQGEYQHSYLGMGGDTFSPICAESLNLPPELRGAIVTTVFTNTPAARAGLRSGTQPSNTRYPGICPQVQGGDVITAIEGQPVTTFEDVLSFLTRYTSPGDTITLDVYRDGRSITVDVTLAARPRN